MRISVRTDVRKALAEVDRVSQRSVHRAASTAITRAARSARVAAVDELRAVVGPKTTRREVSDSIDLRTLRGFGTRQVDGARISIKKIGIPLGRFPCTELVGGVGVTLPTGSIFIPGAFMAKVGGRRGHRGVFLRSRKANRRGTQRRVKRGKTRALNSNRGKLYRPELPIYELFTSAGQNAAISQRVVPKQNARFLERWPIEFERALKQLERSVR